MDPIVLEVSEQSPENNEEALIDRDNDVCDPEFIVAPISQLRSNLADVRGKGFPFLESVQASLILYATELCFQFPEFIGWCAEQYSESERVVIDKKGSKVLCKIDVVSVRESLKIPKSFSENFEPFDEEEMIRVYRECQPEIKTLFLRMIIKLDQFPQSLSFPLSIDIMVSEVQCVFSLLSQVLGLNSDRFIVEVMLGFLLKFFQSESGQVVCINFDEFLADTIHKQLVNFHSLRHFRYCTYLMKIFLTSNNAEIPEAESISIERNMMTSVIFINKVMSKAYQMIFNVKLPRVIEEMRIHLQNPEDRVGDWTLFINSTVIWVYGFHEFHYLLPIFLTPRIFSLEFIRQKIISETENFIKYHRESNIKFPFVIGPFIVKSRTCLAQVEAKLKALVFAQMPGKKYDPHQIISRRRKMNKNAPYEHEPIEGLENFVNLEECVDVEAPVQKAPTQQSIPKVVIKVPKSSTQSKRIVSEAMDIDPEHTARKKMKTIQTEQYVDLEDEGPKEQTCLDMVESGTSVIESRADQLESEGSSGAFHSQKYYFSQASKEAYQSKEDLSKWYAEKRKESLSEIMNLMPEVKKYSQHKSSLFTVRDTERKTFNISIAEEDKVSEIKIKYDNISAPDKVQFHKQTSDLLYSDYLNLNLKNEKLTSLAAKLEGQLRQEKEASKAWQIQIKKLEVDGPKEMKALLDEKDKVILSLKKKLKMPATEHPQTAELVALEQEKEAFKKQSLDFQAKFLQLEKEKLEWSKEKTEMATRVIALSSVVPSVTPSATESKSGTEDIV
jgi:hypothetical protein